MLAGTLVYRQEPRTQIWWVKNNEHGGPTSHKTVIVRRYRSCAGFPSLDLA